MNSYLKQIKKNNVMKEMFVVAWIYLMILIIWLELGYYISEFIDWLVDRKYNNKIIQNN